VITIPEPVDAHVVQQSGELLLAILLCCFAHTRQPGWPAFPSRCPAQVWLLRVLLVSGLPSTTSAGDCSLLFGCFTSTTPLYDSSPPFMRDLPLIAFSLRPAYCPRAVTRSPGSRA
jgi:hypothetical protein